MTIEMGLKPGIAEVPVKAETAEEITLPLSLRMVKRKRKTAVIVSLAIGSLAIVILGLIFIPWQQSVIGLGEVIVFDPMSRPQNIEAQIPARIVNWFVREGDSVKKGDRIAQIEDIDSKFLDPEQPARLQKQRLALLDRQKAVENRQKSLQNQIASLGLSQRAAIPTADERRKQAGDRLKAAEQLVVSATQSVRIAEDVAKQAAAERFRQAQDAIRQAEQALLASQEVARIEASNLERVERLTKQGLRSTRDLELAQNSARRTETDVERAKQSLSIAKTGANLGSLEQQRALLQVADSQAGLARARANLEEVRRGTTVGSLDYDKVKADTAATISTAEAQLASVGESLASIASDLQKLDIERGNLTARRNQQFILAPSSGRIVSVRKVGAGETVKSGDVVAVIAPDTKEQMVELYVTDNDAPFVFVGAPVRVQFAGWPAVQWVGLGPAAAVGTFAGRVKIVDAIDDGKNRYRLVVEPDFAAIREGKEQPWPPPNSRNPNDSLTLRPGAEANGWVMLRRVSLGFELWRQLNSFPPAVDPNASKSSLGKDKQDDYSEEDYKEEKKPKRKIKIK